jgi:hypothetical protein
MKAAKKARLQAESRERKILVAFYGETDFVEWDSTVAALDDDQETLRRHLASNGQQESALVSDLVPAIGNALDQPAFADSSTMIEEILGTDGAAALVHATRAYFELTETFRHIRDGHVPMQGDLAVVISVFRAIGPDGNSGYSTRVAGVLPRKRYSVSTAGDAIAQSMALFGARDNYASDSVAHRYMRLRSAA